MLTSIHTVVDMVVEEVINRRGVFGDGRLRAIKLGEVSITRILSSLKADQEEKRRT